MRRTVSTALFVLALGSAVPSAAATRLGSAKDETELAAAKSSELRNAHPSPSEADLSLLRGLLYAFQPGPREIRILAIEDLALLQDPRALDALRQLAFDPDPQIALAAVKSISHLRHPRAEEILAEVIRTPSSSQMIQVTAVRALPFQRSLSALELLHDLSTSNDFGPQVRNSAQAMLSELATPLPAARKS